MFLLNFRDLHEANP